MNSAQQDSWSPNPSDQSGTCAPQVLGNGLSVTMSPQNASQNAYHICFSSVSLSGLNGALVNMIFEVQVKFVSDVAIGGMIFEQVSSATSEPDEKFIFSIWQDGYQHGYYELCYIKNGGGCTDLIPPIYSGLQVNRDFNLIAVMIQNQSIELYLNDRLLNKNSVLLRNDMHINHINMIGVVAQSSEPSDSERKADLFYREAKVWQL